LIAVVISAALADDGVKVLFTGTEDNNLQIGVKISNGAIQQKITQALKPYTQKDSPEMTAFRKDMNTKAGEDWATFTNSIEFSNPALTLGNDSVTMGLGIGFRLDKLAFGDKMSFLFDGTGDLATVHLKAKLTFDLKIDPSNVLVAFPRDNFSWTADNRIIRVFKPLFDSYLRNQLAEAINSALASNVPQTAAELKKKLTAMAQKGVSKVGFLDVEDVVKFINHRVSPLTLLITPDGILTSITISMMDVISEL
jgi:hypothetical protein